MAAIDRPLSEAEPGRPARAGWKPRGARGTKASIRDFRRVRQSPYIRYDRICVHNRQIHAFARGGVRVVGFAG
jgi:hypothetical protein